MTANHLKKADDLLLTWKDVRRIVPYSRMHVDRLEKVRKFPRRIQVGENRVAWWKSEIDGWLRSRPRRVFRHTQVEDGLDS